MINLTDPKEALRQIQAQKEEIEGKQLSLKEGLPHLYGWKWYAWAKKFFESRNKVNLLCAANQISKSSTNIRKCIHWATYKRIWHQLWPNRTPQIFWYFYPTLDVATVEFEKKWIPEFMPRGEFKDHEIYGWTAIYEKRQISEIRFNSGVTVFFKAYSQNVMNLQTASVDAVFTDEELPEHLYDEIMARMFATDGYFHMVFTATIGQDFWKQAIEGEGDQEKLVGAFKIQVSMYDCQFYTDGSPGGYTLEKIKRIEASCKTEQERQRRVMGKFTSEAGLKYANFDSTKNYCRPFEIPASYTRWAAVDIGSGGENHKPAICFVALSPDNRKGYVYKGWRGDDGSTYTAGDVLEKFRQMRTPEDKLAAQFYDQGAKDFGTLAARAGESFNPSQKSHEIGEQQVNTLFKNCMLYIFDEPELRKLGGELSTIKKDTPKTKAKDDFADSMRYTVTGMPWDWTHLIGLKSELEIIEDEKKPITEKQRLVEEINERRGLDRWGRKKSEPEESGWQDDFEEWQELADGYY